MNKTRSAGAEKRKTAGRPPAVSTSLRLWRLAAACLVASVLLLPRGVLADAGPRTTLHYGPNHNFDANGTYLPSKVGFNLAEVNSVSELDALPSGVKGLVWVGLCHGVDADFVQTVLRYIGRSKVFGFYLMDDPDPTGRYAHPCNAANLKAESDWIHANAPEAKTFIVVMSLASSRSPSFVDTFNPDNSHIDLFGIDPYPCRTELFGCDYDMIDRYVAAAEAWGIPRSRIVPVYQAFGGGNWKDDGVGRYTLPTVSQEQQILARWGKLVATPAFDFAYSWGSQNADAALASAADLQSVFAAHNGASSP